MERGDFLLFLLAFFFPRVHEAIDWTRGYEFLDKEFQKIVREAETGRKTTDKLVKVWLNNGQETWLLIHIEVQSQPESEFAERMYIYNCRIYDRYRQKVLSLAVLADETKSWRPKKYGYKILGGAVIFKFPTVKLLDYTAQTLAESNNPFAVIVAAHRETQKTRQNPDNRYQEKLTIAKSLYRRGYERRDILELFRLIDWMMSLPRSLEENFTREIYRYEEEEKMPYITSVERLGIEKGLQQGLQQGRQEDIIAVLQVRFETVSDALVEAVNGIQDDAILANLLRQAIAIPSLDAFQEILQRPENSS
ncbi:Rpn family recombination-promoting nuclease/putative transposase [Spirulina sp. 06S082]|uniref:Rpn family recombination-promoting nuclease/putative transposase n=1 Tax=Spirulina sp. 06S082 TaxID=3110248 RepID=UPI002B1EEA64|nr:Rpn family recombination-promoting nuclease/putative transposase [Spirulina sp. 06S082]MEA5469318.1 Rpn family recombination-promoting nuclease/putative transposase [Spirulina sp. 06S082]